MTINVIHRDIDQAAKLNALRIIAGRSKRCPIARAAHRHRQLRNCCVGSTYILNLDTHQQHDLPATATRFIGAFDCGKDVQPFSFQLDMEVKGK